jgi:hypothetical protein
MVDKNHRMNGFEIPVFAILLIALGAIILAGELTETRNQ